MPERVSPSNGSLAAPIDRGDVATVSIVGGAVLRAGEPDVRPGQVDCAGSAILAVRGHRASLSAPPDHWGRPRVVDATGCWVLPGLVDLHGDAFGRSLMPRPGVAVDIDLALLDNDRQVLAAGITTSFLSATESSELRLRSRAMLRTIVEGLARRTGGPDVRLQVRHERCQVDDLGELEEWIRKRVVRLLSFSDHTPGGIVDIVGLSTGQIQRASVPAAELERSLANAVAQRPVGLQQERRLAEVTAAGCPTASHDSSGPADLARDLEPGVAIAEFPMSIPLALEYRRHGTRADLVVIEPPGESPARVRSVVVAGRVAFEAA